MLEALEPILMPAFDNLVLTTVIVTIAFLSAVALSLRKSDKR